MDPVTHIGSGLLGGSYFKRKNENGNIYKIAVIGALLPDIDNLVGLTNNPAIYLTHHRGITHSFLGAILLSFIVALVLKLTLFRKTDFKRLFFIFTIFTFVHIFLDLITSYGTQIALPFTNRRYTLESVFIIDPFFTLSIFILFFISKRVTSSWIKIILFLFIFIYPFTNMTLKTIYKNILEKEFPGKVIHLSPAPFTPIFWKVILEDNTNYYVATKTLFGKADIDDFEKYRSLKTTRLSNLFTLDGFLKTYYWFMKYPIVQEVDKNTYKVSDLRFMITLKKLNIKREAPFSILLTTNEDMSKILRYKYKYKY